jgi:hypothetical protein
MAHGRFETALRLDPDNFSALLWSGLADAAARKDILSDKNELDWLAQRGLFYGGAYDPTEKTLEEILTKLRECGVSATVIEEISVAAERRFSRPPEAASAAGRPAEAGGWEGVSRERRVLSKKLAEAAVEDLRFGRTAAALSRCALRAI